MAVNFKIVAPDYAKLNDSISVSGTLTWHATEAVDYMNLYVTDPKGKTASYSISVYGSHDNAYTSAKKLIMDMPGRWKLEYGWVRYVSDPNYPNGILDVSPAKYVNVIDPNAPKPTIEVSPRLSVVKLNDMHTLRMDVKGAQAHHKLVGLAWDIAGQSYQGVNQSITVGPMKTLGTFTAKATATFQDGLGGSFVVTDETTFTVAKGEMTGLGIMISSTTPNVEFGQSFAYNAQVTGAPSDATINYEWYVNGVIHSHEQSMSYVVMSLPLTYDVKVIASIISPSYEGQTIESNMGTVVVSPASEWSCDIRTDKGTSGTFAQENTWPIGAGKSYGPFWTDDPDFVLKIKSGKVSYDDVPMNSTIGANSYMNATCPMSVDKIGQTYKVKVEFEVEGFINLTRVLNPITVVKEYDYVLGKAAPEYITSGGSKLDFIINSKKYKIGLDNEVEVVNLEGKTGQVLSIPIDIEYSYSYNSVFDPAIGTTANDVGNDNLNKFYANKIIEVLDYQNQVVGTVSNGVATVTLPETAKDLAGHIRIRVPQEPHLARSDFTGSVPIRIRVYPNPLTPSPDVTMSFEPSPCVLGSNYNAVVAATPLPASAKVFTKFDDDADFVEANQKTYEAIAMGGRLHSADVKITTDEFDDYFYTVQEAVDVVGKPWPEVTLRLTPSKTNLVVGESLFIDAELTVPTEIADDPNSSFSVEWYKDDVSIPNDFINRNYDLNWIVNKVGDHIFKCRIVIHNIDYDGGHKLIENSVQITTENRKMAITASINPASGSIKFGESQKLSAVVEEAPVDAVIEYVWKVDGVEQTPDVGSNGISITVQGDAVKTKKVVLDVTATAEGSEPGAAQALADVVIAKADQPSFTAVMVVNPEKIKTGQHANAYIRITDEQPGAVFSYKWSTGETTDEINYLGVESGKVTLKCDITSKIDNYNDLKVNRSKTITVEDVTPVDVEGIYIWPLPHIDAAFMYGSWWALDEIQALTVEGKDWKTETTFKYQKEIDAFKQILKDYNIVMIQESRNGRIIDRQKLESGLIY